jgi:hypothetical protein
MLRPLTVAGSAAHDKHAIAIAIAGAQGAM